MAERIRHGGNLREAAREYGIALADWLDLSTGINPCAYPVPPVPADAWRRLPEDGDDLASIACEYYGAPRALPVAGSQAAIRALPGLLRQGTAAVAALTYGEYAPAFRRSGHRVVTLDTARRALPGGIDHVIVANPNNPTTESIERDVLLDWHAQLAARNGTLIVDEAFADAFTDAYAHSSLAAQSARDGLIVLRSVGKFFGLAGIRAGFVLASDSIIDTLSDALGAWTVSGPARHAIRAAFADVQWQAETRAWLGERSAQLLDLVRAQGFDRARATPLFVWFESPRAAELHVELAQKGIWTRLFEHGAMPSVRIGLTATDEQWQRFAAAFKSVTA